VIHYPIGAVDITGYILLGRKKLNIRVTLDDDSSQIVNGPEGETESGDERPAEEHHGHDQLADEVGDALADEDDDQLADEDDDQLADEDENAEADESEFEGRGGGARQGERSDGGNREGDGQVSIQPVSAVS
jgi:hypothetical protein